MSWQACLQVIWELYIKGKQGQPGRDRIRDYMALG